MLLIIDRTKGRAESISEIFYYMGIISYAATPTEALSEISPLYKAVLISKPEDFPDIADYVRKLRSYDSSVPIFAISDKVLSVHVSDLFERCFSDSIYSSTLVGEIAKYQNARNLPVIAYYRLAGIDASCDINVVKVFDKSFPLTKTETMILRYMIASYPLPQSPKNILKYAFKPSKKPEITGIRTHISVMNKKFRSIRNRNLFIAVPSQGYVIPTPEVLQSFG